MAGGGEYAVLLSIYPSLLPDEGGNRRDMDCLKWEVVPVLDCLGKTAELLSSVQQFTYFIYSFLLRVLC